jgi:hypothetical protein
MPYWVLIDTRFPFAYALDALRRRWSRRRPRRSAPLACARCGSSALCPTDWRADDPQGWTIDGRCGECGAWQALRLSNAQAARLDVDLDAQRAAIERDADALEMARMRDELETFAEALRRDLVGPDDFGRRRAPAIAADPRS